MKRTCPHCDAVFVTAHKEIEHIKRTHPEAVVDTRTAIQEQLRQDEARRAHEREEERRHHAALQECLRRPLIFRLKHGQFRGYDLAELPDYYLHWLLDNKLLGHQYLGRFGMTAIRNILRDRGKAV